MSADVKALQTSDLYSNCGVSFALQDAPYRSFAFGENMTGENSMATGAPLGAHCKGSFVEKYDAATPIECFFSLTGERYILLVSDGLAVWLSSQRCCYCFDDGGDWTWACKGKMICSYWDLHVMDRCQGEWCTNDGNCMDDSECCEEDVQPISRSFVRSSMVEVPWLILLLQLLMILPFARTCGTGRARVGAQATSGRFSRIPQADN